MSFIKEQHPVENRLFFQQIQAIFGSERGKVRIKKGKSSNFTHSEY